MKFPRAFYIANTLEIFERLAWYGFFTVSSLYMSSPKSQGGMAFTDAERGFLQGLIPFLLYLFPVITGALADRYGYKRMFWISFFIMCPGYYLLGQAQGFWSFFFAFLAVAIGAACFKPVVLGTISRTTSAQNRGLGFGIFYTMINLGGFLGPFVAGYVRAISWEWVFIMSACWIAINMLILGLFYREPENEACKEIKLDDRKSKDSRSLKVVLVEAQEVLGNARLAFLLIPLIIGLLACVKFNVDISYYIYAALCWLGINLIWSQWVKINENASLTNSSHRNPLHNSPKRPFDELPSGKWYQQPIVIGEANFLLYLLILAGFWTVYNQLFFTLPLYIRDFVDTSDLVRALYTIHPNLANFMAQVNVEQLSSIIETLDWNRPAGEIRSSLTHYKILLPIELVESTRTAIASGILEPQFLAKNWAQQYRQINPEYIINLDFGAIILFQIVLSQWLQRFSSLKVIALGTVVLALANLIGGLAHMVVLSGFMVVAGVLVFALGEMVASPKSQEYIAALAPANKAAVFMGYYFVSMALGMLFGGLLSGWAYGTLAHAKQAPYLMWGLFALIGLVSAAALFIFQARLLNDKTMN
ncbi:MFS transporter [Simiduia curdlanivorans]|uniref:MFS transporter n=1 Tax=Simiduia curdlanivorans TaxID=1492769 RepID=A0ABV8V1V0_9GAMM|nr:MFS transporter [Simiduia curdlanivorans]MDN3640073.1 MFS transporter [Simiduia curdlanivorans]